MKETGRYGIEAKLKKAVKAAGGDTRKFVSPGRVGVPDQIVIWTRKPRPLSPTRFAPYADIHFVETKAPKKGPRTSQVREQKRLLARGCDVFNIDTVEQIDAYVARYA